MCTLCIYVFTQVRVISISIPISIPISTYLPTKPSSIDHRFLFPSSPSRSRVRLCMCVQYVYIYMNLWKDSPPCPVRPPRKKKRNVRFGGFAPPLPCDGSSHIQSQLDKASQGKASYLPTCLQKN